MVEMVWVYSKNIGWCIVALLFGWPQKHERKWSSFSYDKVQKHLNDVLRCTDVYEAPKLCSKQCILQLFGPSF